MSQPDLLERLRESRPMAPAELREHVRQITGRQAPLKRPRRAFGFTWRRSLVLAVPVAAIAAGAVVLGRGGSRQASVNHPRTLLTPPLAANTATHAAPGSLGVRSSPSGVAAAKGERAAVPAPSPNRIQRVSTSLDLRVADAAAVSEDAKRAQKITRSLGGYASRLEVDARGRSGYADLVLRIPKQKLQKAVARLSALGTITGENVSIQDITAQVDATARKIARLKAKLIAWQQQYQTARTQREIASLTDEIGKLERGRKATIRTASDATLDLELTTRTAPVPPHRGMGHFNDLGVAFRWIGIGAVYALALGSPAALLLAAFWLATRALRRRREEALLSRP